MSEETRGMTENIGDEWRKIRDSGRKIRSLDTIGIHS